MSARATSTNAIRLRCPYCGSEEVASLDRYYGTCAGEAWLVGGEREFEPGGYTEINWDTCKEESLQCENCYEPFALEEMVTVEDAPRKITMHAWRSLAQARLRVVNSGAFTQAEITQLDALIGKARQTAFPEKEPA